MTLSATKKVAIAFFAASNLAVVADDFFSLKESQIHGGEAGEYSLVNKGIKNTRLYLASEFGETSGNLISLATTTIVLIPHTPGMIAGEILKKSLD